MTFRRTPNAPASWESADCLEQGVYYIIPIGLWELVERDVGADRFSSEDRRRETEIATAAKHYKHAAAICRGNFVSYGELFPLDPVTLNEEAARFLNRNPVEAKHLARQLTETLEETNRPLRAYLGGVAHEPRVFGRARRSLFSMGDNIGTHRLSSSPPKFPATSQYQQTC